MLVLPARKSSLSVSDFSFSNFTNRTTSSLQTPCSSLPPHPLRYHLKLLLELVVPSSGLELSQSLLVDASRRLALCGDPLEALLQVLAVLRVRVEQRSHELTRGLRSDALLDYPLGGGGKQLVEGRHGAGDAHEGHELVLRLHLDHLHRPREERRHEVVRGVKGNPSHALGEGRHGDRSENLVCSPDELLELLDPDGGHEGDDDMVRAEVEEADNLRRELRRHSNADDVRLVQHLLVVRSNANLSRKATSKGLSLFLVAWRHLDEESAVEDVRCRRKMKVKKTNMQEMVLEWEEEEGVYRDSEILCILEAQTANHTLSDRPCPHESNTNHLPRETFKKVNPCTHAPLTHPLLLPVMFS
eukprot:759088-Hanusia_phi.AAC.1